MLKLSTILESLGLVQASDINTTFAEHKEWLMSKSLELESLKFEMDKESYLESQFDEAYNKQLDPLIDYNECPDCFVLGRLEDNGDVVCPYCGQIISSLAYHTM